MKVGDRYIAPDNETEKKLVDIWVDVLKVESGKIGIDSNFFELGGHSLLATILISRIQQEFDVNIPLNEIFKNPFIRTQAKYIDNSEKRLITFQDDNLVLLRKGNHETKHFFLIHAGSGVVEGYRDVCSHLLPQFHCWGIQADKLKNYTPQNLTNEGLAARYIEKIKKVQPNGTYYIGGWCIGGTIAFEMVNQLEEKGEMTDKFLLINSLAPQEDLLRMDIVDFSLEGELNWIKRNFPDGETKEKLLDVSTVEEIWPLIIDFLEAGDWDKENIVNLFSQIVNNERKVDIRAIPNYDRLGIPEMINFFNVIRIYRKIRAAYIPAKKINTPLYFIGANQDIEDIVSNKELWNNYCSEPMRFIEINGDHFSIWQEPDSGELIKLINKVLSDTD